MNNVDIGMSAPQIKLSIIALYYYYYFLDEKLCIIGNY
jgi:hypothetical protein